MEKRAIVFFTQRDVSDPEWSEWGFSGEWSMVIRSGTHDLIKCIADKNGFGVHAEAAKDFFNEQGRSVSDSTLLVMWVDGRRHGDSDEFGAYLESLLAWLPYEEKQIMLAFHGWPDMRKKLTLANKKPLFSTFTRAAADEMSYKNILIPLKDLSKNFDQTFENAWQYLVSRIDIVQLAVIKHRISRLFHPILLDLQRLEVALKSEGVESPSVVWGEIVNIYKNTVWLRRFHEIQELLTNFQERLGFNWNREELAPREAEKLLECVEKDLPEVAFQMIKKANPLGDWLVAVDKILNQTVETEIPEDR